MARGARMVVGVWLASLALLAGCDREAPGDAGGAAAVEQTSAVEEKKPVAEAKLQADAADPEAKRGTAAVHAPEDPAAARRAAEAKAPDAPARTHGGVPEPTRGPEGTAAASSGVASGSAASGSAGATSTAPLMSVEPPSPTLLIVSAPPTVYTLTSEAPITQGPKPRLVQRSVERNAIIDEDKWLERNGLEMPTFDRPPRPGGPLGLLRKPGGAPIPPHALPPAPPPRNPLPAEIPVELAGARIAEAIRSTPFSIAIYPVGSFDQHGVVVRDDAGKLLGALDLSAFAHVPGDTGHSRQDVVWAQVQDGVLFVSTFHMGYASDSGGLNAFLTALDLATGTILWRSEPLVSNSRNFLVRDGWIITGYGFTAEPDFLFVLDGKTGEVVQRMKVKSGPEMILEKDGIIYVRTYDRDYELVAKTK